jgi:hypothetical protein
MEMQIDLPNDVASGGEPAFKDYKAVRHCFFHNVSEVGFFHTRKASLGGKVKETHCE